MEADVLKAAIGNFYAIIRRAVMAQIEIDNEEIMMLEDILQSYLSDLRMEIADTDLQEYREGLKVKKDVLVKILDELKESTRH